MPRLNTGKNQKVIPMDRQKIEDEALHLSKEDRALLIRKLVLSLDSPTPEDLRAEWLNEAQRRAEELDQGEVQSVSADEVLQKARALIK
jgi:putative addiction module component (TIGR02574 family)